MDEYRIGRIGCQAFQAISAGTGGQVIGVTSRGVFLLIDGDQVVYISGEKEISPLTVTLDPGPPDWQAIQVRDLVRIDKRGIGIGGSIFCVTIGAAVWQPPPPDLDKVQPASGILDQLVLVVLQLIELKGDAGWMGCLANLAGQKFKSNLQEIEMVEKQVHRLRLALFSERQDRVLAALKPFYGSGRGLTPSGDDFIIGLLLVLSRWSSIVKYHPDIPPLLERIASESATCTTRISRAMISSAAQGGADERLLSALDGIITGTRSARECAELLARYGGSSGVDALVGMAVGMVDV